MKQLLIKINQFIITLKSSILFIFVTLLLSTTLLIILATTIRFTKTINYVSHNLMEDASSSVLQELTSNIRPAQSESNFTAHLLQLGVIKQTTADLIPLTLGFVKNLPLVVSAFWGDEQGNMIHSQKENDGSVTTKIYAPHPPASTTIIYRKPDNTRIKVESFPGVNYDPRIRPWYIAAKKDKKTIWTDVYVFAPFVDIGMSAASPVYKNGVLSGVFAISIDLKHLSDFIKNQKITPNGFSFVINEKGDLIAFPTKPPFTSVRTQSKFNMISAKSIPIISQSLEKYRKSGKDKLTFTYIYDDQTYMISYQKIPILASHGWMVGIIAPKSDFTHILDKINEVTLIIAVIILIIGVILVSRFSSHIVQPIKSLVVETENIKNFNLDGEIPISSKIKEIIELKNAINSMKLGLKLFQRYIPKVLVRQLIEAGKEVSIGGERKTLAVLFSDIENFTTIAEKIEPNLLMVQMGEYFEDMTQIIIKEKGTIDKYIGDSIMAFWGAPVPVDNPCHLAARAALNFQSKLVELNAKWIKKGNLVFLTRIGIHTGDAIVGNLGSSERFSYTALGDTVNIASRLENINKYYNTRIIVSDIVYAQIKDAFLLRMIDCIVVKGRTQSTCIYELLGDNQHPLTFDFAAYKVAFEQGFLAYKEQHWDEAIVCFQKCLEIYPDDYIALIFIKRCEQFKVEPPVAGWDGSIQVRI